MIKLTSLFLLMALLSVSCNKSEGGGGSDSAAVDSTTPAVSDETGSDANDGDSDSGETDDGDTTTPPAPVPNVPAQALSFDTNVGLLNFTSTQATKYRTAIELVKLVVATEEFKNKVLNFKYNGSKQFANNNGKTNSQIYQSILDAAETLQPAKNNRMDLDVELYYSNNSVVGYTYASSTQIWVNTKFFNQYQPNSVAGNLFHEWLHKLGYGHDSSSTSKRPYSVPYGIGYIMADIAQDFL